MQREFVYDLLSHRQKYQGYRRYVEAGLDEEIKDFYDRGRTGTVIGDENFVTWVREKKWQKLDDKGFVAQVLPGRLTMDALIPLVAAYYKLDTKRLTQVVKGPKKGLLARKVAMYLCQQLGGHRLTDIMHTFGLSNVGSVSFITAQIRQRINEQADFVKTIQRLTHYVIRKVT